jgi:hypothetical protein
MTPHSQNCFDPAAKMARIDLTSCRGTFLEVVLGKLLVVDLPPTMERNVYLKVGNQLDLREIKEITQ